VTTAVRAGVRLGVDVGRVRVGVAASDPDGVLATPVVTLRRDGSDVDALAALVAERGVVEVVVGLPVGLSGREGAAATAARAYADELAHRITTVAVRLVDERFTTVVAERALRAGARRGGARARRTVVDQQAAVVILQAALDAARAGEAVE
jgi:putative Holliday junction resolvase